MIRKLRIKLVIASMVSLLLVLAAMIGTAAVLSYQSILTEADTKLQLLRENDGQIPEDVRGRGPGFSPEMPFELRFFTVRLSEDNSVQEVNTGRIAAVDEAQAILYAREIYESGRKSGFVDSYRFAVSTEEGDAEIIFLDCGRDLESFHRFLLNSIAVAFIGFAAVLLLLVLLSSRIVKPVAEAYEKQRRFITDAGHELKTPLSIISADTEVLEMDYGENEWLDDIRSQTARLAELTNNLVFLARMEEQPRTERAEFSLSDAVQEAVDDFLAVAKTKKKKLTASVVPNLRMYGDEKTICRMIAIFLDNAVKYTDENGTIHLSLDKWRGQLRLQVYNTTEHIDRESLSHLFDRFYRTDKSRNSMTGGYGLGLSIASAIVTLHGGKVTAATADEKSLLITVIFPG